jgi:hypothetical protein
MIKYYWSRHPGVFVCEKTGEVVEGAIFNGSVCEWNETLIETIIDLAIESKIKTKKINLKCHNDVSTILQTSIFIDIEKDKLFVRGGDIKFFIQESKRQKRNEIYLMNGTKKVGSIEILEMSFDE